MTEKRILIADDEPGIRETLKLFLELEGFLVFEAEDGEKAWEIFKTTEVDIVISDIRMPFCDGIELTKRIKEINPKTPVILFVNAFSGFPLEEAEKLGIQGVIQKPFRPQLVVETIRKL